MMHSQYATVDALLLAPEGERIQFKEAKKRYGFDEAAQVCCALANDGGGKLVFGITDKRPRLVVGSTAFPQPERTRMDLMNKLGIQVDFQVYGQGANRVLVFEVASRPLGLPVQVKGIAWHYVGDSLQPMSQEKLREIYNESGHDFSAQICPGATLADLDPAAVEDFRRLWIEKSGNQRIAGLSVRQLLLDCEAITPEGLTYAALILFGSHAALGKHLPLAEIIFEYRSNEVSGPAQQREEFRTGFFLCHERLWELVNLRNDKQHYQEGLFVFDIPTFNERVVREALLNAVSHRNYQMGGSVFLRQYPDRLLVESPGGLPHGVTFENILDRQNPRNRLVASLLARCGLVERSGQGMNKIYELTIQEAKALPEFTGSDANFLRIILHGMVLDHGLLAVMGRIGEEQLKNFSTDDFLIVNNLFHEKSLTPAMKPRLKRLMEVGVVERASRGKYLLSRRLYAAAGKPGTHTRLSGLDRETQKELILKHLRNSEEHGVPLRELYEVLPGHDRNQLQVLMKQLKREGRVFVVGRTSAARWYANTENAAL